MVSGTKRLAAHLPWLVVLVLLAALPSLVLPSLVHAQGKTSVLSPSSGSETVEKRHLGRISTSLGKAIKGKSALLVSSTACRSDRNCIAAAGREQGSDRAVGIRVTRKRDKFTLELLLVSSANGQRIAQTRVSLDKRDLPSKSGALILDFIEHGPRAPVPPVDSARAPTAIPKVVPGAAPLGDPKLRVRHAKTFSGDGVSVVPVQVFDSPKPQAGELKRVLERPVLICDGASTLPALGDTAAAILAPAVTTPTTVRCTAEHREATTNFSVQFTPPSQGLRARPDRFRVIAGDNTVELEVTHAGQPASDALRIASSAGTATMLGEGRVKIALPTGKAPRTVALVLSDGQSTGVAFVPVTGKTKLRVVAQKGSTIVVRIAGLAFGPLRARRRVTRVPIEVPPGATRAVVRATDRRGYAIESVSDLRIPKLGRIAALGPSKSVVILETAEVFVALAGSDGRPANAKTSISAQADRGSVEGVRFVSPGLFAVTYRAPETPGDAQLTVGEEGDLGAGTATVSLAIAAGKALGGEIQIPPGPYRPGAVVSGTAVFRDGEGNPIREGTPTATINGSPIAVAKGEAGFQFQVTVPTKLPKNRTLALNISLNKSSLAHSIRTTSDVPTSATVRSTTDGRASALVVDVKDRYGNRSDPSGFELVVDGASRGPLRVKKNHFEVTLTAEGTVRFANVDVLVDDKPLAHARVPFEPPPGTLRLGAYARGAWASNLAGVSPPHLGAGLGIHRVGTTFEFAAFAGIESYLHSDEVTANLAGADREVDRSVLAIAFPIQLRGRLRLHRKVGLHIAGGLIPTLARVSIKTDFQGADNYTEITYGARALIGADLQLGPGRLLVGGAYTRTKLKDGLLTGNLEGVSVSAGYEWWFSEVLSQ